MSIARIAVLGGNVEAALTAAVLARSLTRQTEAVLHPEAGTPQPEPALVTLPSYNRLHELLSFDVRDVLRACGGTLRGGTVYRRLSSREFTTGFGEDLPAADGHSFHQHWLRLHRDEEARLWADYQLAARLAEGGHMPLLTPSQEGFGLHLDYRLYTDFLRRAAVHYGARTLDSTSPTDGDDLQSLDADLVIDCSERQLPTSDPDWHSVPGSPVEWKEVATPENPSATVFERQGKEVAVHVPLAQGGWVGAWNLGAAGVNGWSEGPWRGKVVRLGPAACRLSPLAGPRLRIAQIGIEALLKLLPVGGPGEAERGEYARVTTEGYKRLHEHEELHLALAGELPQPSTDVQRKIEQFRSRGRVVLFDEESYTAEEHLAVYDGYGVVPDRYSKALHAVPPGVSRALLDKQLRDTERKLADTPPQKQVLSTLHRRRSPQERPGS
ncbi:tryptophan 7-halogenase [Parvularcula maris]|uniref:Tryptophan 7-halogenase n=1 Tax=Parvularcula maris TaxID=2965077 RepID=A0A9X2LAK5_9PROT|nr:tryptophan 7-halogenase [Parvularcula maris]MCQ8186102.1 tryptophan 7-halogenase [Parvularcula maris]